jgi:hypothetical protein
MIQVVVLNRAWDEVVSFGCKGGNCWEGVKTIGTIQVNNYTPRLEVLNKKKPSVKFNGTTSLG